MEKSSLTRLDRIRGSFLLGACGDALGAAVEGILKLDEIIARHGAGGLDRMIPFTNPYGRKVDFPEGLVTDDTTQLMTTAAAMTLTNLAPRAGFMDDLRPLLHQGLVNWAVPQDYAQDAAQYVDPSLAWPPETKSFWFFCGAGAGTIAALTQGYAGSVDKPVKYDFFWGKEHVMSPGRGCGGMMRVAPLAFLEGYAPADIFTFACENAAITHGHPTAYVAAGAVALYAHFAARGMEAGEAMEETRKVLRDFAAQPAYAEGVSECLRAIDHAEKRAREEPLSLRAIDALPRELGFDKAFQAVPVLAGVTYAVCCDAGPGSVRQAMITAVNHGGDSDSVGAMAGNVLGAKYGAAVVPRDWLDTLRLRPEMEGICAKFDHALALAAAPRRGVRSTPAPSR
jgi:ADP-ribosylglycohydrolase